MRFTYSPARLPAEGCQGWDKTTVGCVASERKAELCWHSLGRLRGHRAEQMWAQSIGGSVELCPTQAGLNPVLQ